MRAAWLIAIAAVVLAAAPSAHGQVAGWCCFTDGTCSDVSSQAQCEAVPGAYYLGDGSTQTDCLSCVRGACCATDGTCTEVSEAQCDAEGGVFQGAGTVCDPDPCPKPGACCFESTGDCSVILPTADPGNQITAETKCINDGGVYQGDLTVCDPDPCPKPGACCFESTGDCSVIIPTAAPGNQITAETKCINDGGVYQGDLTVCDPDPCPKPGACCFESTGDCSVIIPTAAPGNQITAETKCINDGGVYQGDLTVCDPDPCPKPGACCFESTGDCSVIIPTAAPGNQITAETKCINDGGVYQGDLTVCDPDPCPKPGACCFPNGDCSLIIPTAAPGNQITAETKCINDGGLYQGDNTVCSNSLCKYACCVPDGSCVLRRRVVCENTLNGVWTFNAVCADVEPCPQPGACCLPDGSCVQNAELESVSGECGGQGGIYQGDDTVCSNDFCKYACCLPDGTCIVRRKNICEGANMGQWNFGEECADVEPCPQPGACCLPDGSCEFVAEFACDNAGGIFQGVDVPCYPNPCSGACCFHDGTCMLAIRTVDDSPEDVCLMAGGKYQGDGTTCDPNLCPRNHPGWNWVDNLIKLTKNEPCYWSALTGQPKGLSPFTVLDPPPPGTLPGRPAMDGSDDRVLRGYVLAYAIDVNGNEIRWNHLKGDATIVNYASSSSWEYNAYSFPVVAPVANGAPTGTPGDLNLDGVEYAEGFDLLLMDFYAAGSRPFGEMTAIDTDLTLLPISVDLRQETDGPITTKAHFDVWNEYEVKFSGAYRCITCWDQWLLSRHGIPNHFAYSNLQTDKGKARIDGLASQLCDYDNDKKDQKELGEDPNDIISVDASLIGVVAKHIYFGVPAVADVERITTASAGTNLHGMGTQPGIIRVDTLGPPDEALAPGEDGFVDPVTELLRMAGISVTTPQSTRDSGTAAQGGAAGTASGARVSASDKGSLIIFPKVEIRWDVDGNLIQDTFLDLSNDYPADVQVQLYFINGDPAMTSKKGEEKKEEEPFVKDPIILID